MARTKKENNPQGREIIQQPTHLSSPQKLEMSKRTPKAFIKQRQGRGGGMFDYVEVGYVIDRLNTIFGELAWDVESELVPELTTPDFVTVKATLTIKDHKGNFIKKQAFGGVDRKYLKGTKNYVDIGDDAKSAEADAFKKAASKIGIAFDVFYPDVLRVKEMAIEEKVSAPHYCDRCKKLGKKTVITEEQAQKTKEFFNYRLCDDCRVEAMKYKAESEAKKTPSKTEGKMVQCKRCTKEISEAQAKYSKKMFKKPLCKECQKKEK